MTDNRHDRREAHLKSRLSGWLSTLAIMVIAATALFWGAWKSALLLVTAALVAAPIRWTRGPLRHLPAEHLERGVLCLTLAILGMIATSVETSSGPTAQEMDRESLAAMPGRARAASGGLTGMAPPLPERVITPEERATSWQRAIAAASDCDSAHNQAAGAIDRIMQAPDAPETRAAVLAAVESCEASWIIFNRPELRSDADGPSARVRPAIEACDQGYMSRWLANEDLRGALEKGLTVGDIGKITRMNDEHDPAVSACAALLEEMRG